MVQVTIDGQAVTCADGATILDAARQAGIEIPTLCHDDRLAPTGECRLCLVESGAARPVPACMTVVREGMSVCTSSPTLQESRTTTLRLLALNHAGDALAADEVTPFSRLLRQHGLVSYGSSDPDRIDDSHPYIHVDLSRCVDCYRCVRICHDLQGQDVWHVRGRGVRTEVWPAADALALSACVACGACVDTCPSGALEDRTTIERGAATMWTRTVCPYCGVGCELEYGTRDGRMVAARPVLDAPVNKGHCCVKGRYAFDFVHADDRVATPMIRGGAGWRPSSWPEALGVVADGIRQIIARHGPDAVGVLGSARATNEENYLVQKLARVALGTNNVDCCARVCHAPSAAALKQMLGTGAATNSFDDLERARTILVCGANVTENHPVIGARIRQAARRGATLIVIDPRRIELARVPGALHLALRPGTNVALLNAMAQVVVAEGLVDREFVQQHVDGLADWQAFLEDFAPERAEAICGVPADAIRLAARAYATGGPAIIFHGLGITEHTQGVDGVKALVNLALATGNIGEPGTGVNPLRGQNNVQGAAQMGCDPASLTGGIPIESGRPLFESVWRAPVPATAGRTMLEMLDEARAGRLKALVVFGYDILLTNPDASSTRRALEALDLLVVVDLFRTETAGFADVFLPACSSFEKHGTFMNAERRVQRVRPVVPRVGESLSDAEIVCRLGSALGHARSFSFDSPAEIWDEIRAVWPAARGMTYERLEAGGLQWPCPSEDHPGTTRLYTDGFPGARRRFAILPYRPTAETTSDEYPLLLNTGRTLFQFNAGTMTSRTPNQGLRPTDLLEISPVDARRLTLTDGQEVEVTSRHGRAVLPIRITDEMRIGEAFATFHSPAVFLNQITTDHRDPIGTPEYKVTAIRIAPRNLLRA